MRPRLGFLGTGWIGRQRLAAIVADGRAEVIALCDPDDASATAALALAPGARRAASLDALLDSGLDGLVIATPSAGHAAEALAALTRGVAVFCQKPLGRSGAEAAAVVAAAQAADRLLGVDFSYRGTAAAQAMRAEVRSGALGRVFALDLTFHNAWGPDQPWFHDRARSGGGCVIDLGVHLVDLALWLLDGPEVEAIEAHAFAGGRPARPDAVEDYATAQLTLAGGVAVRLACSWHLHAGAGAVIAAQVHGSAGGASLHNLAGSFTDFAADRLHGTARTPLVVPPDDWGGRMATGWVARLADGARFDPAAETLVTVAATVERIYRAAFAFGADGRRYQTVEPAPGPSARPRQRLVDPRRQPGPEHCQTVTG